MELCVALDKDLDFGSLGFGLRGFRFWVLGWVLKAQKGLGVQAPSIPPS